MMPRHRIVYALGYLKAKFDAISVVTMSAVPDWAELGLNKKDHIDVTCMGQAASIGLGLALGKPDRLVMVVDGDGSLLMELGVMALIGQQDTPNLHHFVMCNGVYESTGGQKLSSVDWFTLAKGARYAITSGDVPTYLGFNGPALYPLAIEQEPPLPWPHIDFKEEVAQLRKDLEVG